LLDGRLDLDLGELAVLADPHAGGREGVEPGLHFGVVALPGRAREESLDVLADAADLQDELELGARLGRPEGVLERLAAVEAAAALRQPGEVVGGAGEDEAVAEQGHGRLDPGLDGAGEDVHAAAARPRLLVEADAALLEEADDLGDRR